MKTNKSSKLTTAKLVTLVVLVSASSAFAYPPDNAAVLYYKAAVAYERPDGTMRDMMSDLAKGKMKANEKIAKHIESNRHVIEYISDAGDITNCDWGYKNSKGLDMMMPALASCRRLAYLVIADARVFADESDYEVALEHCLSIQKMGCHVADENLVSYLVGTSLNHLANNCIQDILGDMPEDLETLNWLKEQLVRIKSKFPSFRTPLEGENKMVMIEMRPERVEEVLKACEKEDADPADPNSLAYCLRNADNEFFVRNREYWNSNMAIVKSILDLELPYSQTYAKFHELDEKITQEVNEKNPDATLTATFLPAYDRVYSIRIKGKTLSNAIKAAIEIYMTKVKTGRLPDTLPEGLPVDLFSGEPFEYEKSSDGFILRCRGKNLSDKEGKRYEYEFKVKK
ncbi:MAG: hypothetical protein ACYS9Y_09765 [Planctomycetota bacterium]|jgi:hypothetical protein